MIIVNRYSVWRCLARIGILPRRTQRQTQRARSKII